MTGVPDPPIYLRLAEDVEAAIRRGQFGDGGRLPTERQLADKYGVNRRTAARALDHLRAKGLVSRTVGRGSFAVARRFEYHATGETNYWAKEDGSQIVPRHRITAIAQVRAFGWLAAAMTVPPDEPLVMATRIRFAENEVPLAFGVEYYRQRYFPGLRDVLGQSSSSSELARLHYGFALQRRSLSFQLEPAGAEAAEQLLVRPGTPLLKVEGLRTLHDGTPVLWAESFYHGGVVKVHLDFVP